MLKFGNTYLNFGGTYLTDWDAVPNPNPFNLPAYTVRLKFYDNAEPTFYKGTAVQVSQSPNIWDLTYENSDWYKLLLNQTDLIEVIGANTTNVTSMSYIFSGCINLSKVAFFDTSNVTNMSGMFASCSDSLESIPRFDTSNVTDMNKMFYGCSHLNDVPLLNTSKVTNMANLFWSCVRIETVPLFDTSNVTNMLEMLRGCYKLKYIPLYNTSKVTKMTKMCMSCNSVRSGALALYQQASSQTTPPSAYTQAFYECGINTETGAAELAQIPSDWK